ncbi:MAG TPA: hypothetical protein VJX28_06830 [Chthoniobacterales bacterium]|nr:hypothetical protein [Chthoniobacterales bacterium]
MSDIVQKVGEPIDEREFDAINVEILAVGCWTAETIRAFADRPLAGLILLLSAG